MGEPNKREYCYITSGCLDARDIKFSRIPVGIIPCPLCDGNGKRQQYYCDAGRTTGRCDFCDVSGFVYEATSRGVPPSVTNQIAVANGLNVRRFDIYGLDWSDNAQA